MDALGENKCREHGGGGSVSSGEEEEQRDASGTRERVSCAMVEGLGTSQGETCWCLGVV